MMTRRAKVWPHHPALLHHLAPLHHHALPACWLQQGLQASSSLDPQESCQLALLLPVFGKKMRTNSVQPISLQMQSQTPKVPSMAVSALSANDDAMTLSVDDILIMLMSCGLPLARCIFGMSCYEPGLHSELTAQITVRHVSHSAFIMCLIRSGLH